MDQPGPRARAARHRRPPRRVLAWSLVAVLLAVAVAGTLWVPAYARADPRLGPFPFFYWYQLLWIPLVAILSWLAYLLARRAGRPRGRSGEAP